jgi:CRP/FNR family transcriptional regulator, cyclic AMP receptor protein
MATTRSVVGSSSNQVERTGEFFKKLSPAAYKDLSSLQYPVSYAANRILFSEREQVHGVFVVLEGEVKLSINSSDGRRLSLHIARKGDILGLSSVLSGNPYEMTAETLYPSRLAPIGRQDFLNFVAKHPEVYQTLMEELSRQYSMACGQLRTVGLASTAPEKLARLLLDWSDTGQTTDHGSKLRFSMTHEEIGEFIGASRETVTRTLSVFKSRRLVMFSGSMLTIPNRVALEDFAHC